MKGNIQGPQVFQGYHPLHQHPKKNKNILSQFSNTVLAIKDCNISQTLKYKENKCKPKYCLSFN